MRGINNNSTWTSMENCSVTAHARKRKQLRGIPSDAVEVLLNYGKRVRGRGAIIACMTKKSRHHARRRMGAAAYSRISDKLDIYLVLDNATGGDIITVGHRTRRLKR